MDQPFDPSPILSGNLPHHNLPTINSKGVVQPWHAGMPVQPIDEFLHNAIRVEESPNGRLYAVAKLPEEGFGKKIQHMFWHGHDNQHGFSDQPGEIRIKLPNDTVLPDDIKPIQISKHGGAEDPHQWNAPPPIVGAPPSGRGQPLGPTLDPKNTSGPRYLGPPIRDKKPGGEDNGREPRDPPIFAGGGWGGGIGPVPSGIWTGKTSSSAKPVNIEVTHISPHGHQHQSATNPESSDQNLKWLAASKDGLNPLGGFSPDGNVGDKNKS